MVLHLLFFSAVLFASTKEETPLRSVTHGFLGSCILSRGRTAREERKGEGRRLSSWAFIRSIIMSH